MNRIWRIKSPETQLSLDLARSVGISRITAQLLVNRGIKDETEAKHFLYGDLTCQHDPFLFKDMQKIVAKWKHYIKFQKEFN